MRYAHQEPTLALSFVAFFLLIVAFLVATVPMENFGAYDCEKYKKLDLRSVCSDRRGRHMWVVVNPNSKDIPFTWSYLLINKGSGVAVKNGTTVFIAPRWGVCTIHYKMGTKGYQETEVANLKFCN